VHNVNNIYYYKAVNIELHWLYFSATQHHVQEIFFTGAKVFSVLSRLTNKHT
jgi:hypothetical protein